MLIMCAWLQLSCHSVSLHKINEFAHVLLFAYILSHTDTPTQPPTLTPLSLECTSQFNPTTQEICVNCTSSRNLASLDFVCSLNGQLITDGCELFLQPKLQISVEFISHIILFQVENSRSVCLLLDSPRECRPS